MNIIRSWNIAAAMTLLAASCLLSACQTRMTPTPLPKLSEVTDKVDTGLMTDKPCAPPCWQSIRPGDPKIDAVAALKSSPLIDASTVFDGASIVSFSGGFLEIDDSANVSRIRYTLGYQLPLNDLIARYGDPDGFDYFFNGERASIATFDIIWLSRGLVVTVQKSIHAEDMVKVAPLRPDDLVAEAFYFDPQTTPKQYPVKFKWQGYVPLPSP